MIRLPNLLELRFAVLVALLGASFDANAAVTYLPPIGGSGGAQFIRHCSGSQSTTQEEISVSLSLVGPFGAPSPPANLAGFELRAGDDIDAIRPLCVRAYSTGSVTAPKLTPGSGLIDRDTKRPASSGFVELPLGWSGGIGGHLTRVVCPNDRPIVIAMSVAAEGVNTVTVNNIHLYCGLAAPSQQLDENPSAIFDAPKASGSSAVLGFGGSTVSNTSAFQRCPEGQVAVGVHGRSGEWIDAIGLICDAPRIIKAVALGRVESTTPPDPSKTICDYAKSARARNSPAAPGLEKQCAAQGQAAPVAPMAATAKKVDHGYLADLFDPAPDAGAAPPAPIDPAQLDALAARGAEIAGIDRAVAVARNAEVGAFYRLGFDIATGLFGDPALGAQGSVLVGPGATKIRDSLSASGQRGFNDSVKFHLARDYSRP
jgi:hypothetical protein